MSWLWSWWSLLRRSEVRFRVVKSASSWWNSHCRGGTRIVMVESASSWWDLLHRRSCVVEPTFLVSNLGVVLFRCLLLWPGVRYKASQWDGRNEGVKTSHDICRGSCFVTHFAGLPFPGSPLMFTPSLVPSLSEDEPPTSLWKREGRRLQLWLALVSQPTSLTRGEGLA